MANHTTRAQRINARQDKVWAKALQAQKEARAIMSNQLIASDETSRGYLVSTVRLSSGQFETMVFGLSNGRRDWDDLWCRRATTRADALKHHKTALSMYGDGE